MGKTPTVSPYSEVYTGHRLGKAFPETTLEESELLFTQSTETSTVWWPLRTTGPVLKVPKSFPGPWPGNVCKITKTPSNRSRDPELPNPWVPQHLAVPASSEKGSETRDPLICFGSFPKSLMLVQGRGPGLVGRGARGLRSVPSLRPPKASTAPQAVSPLTATSDREGDWSLLLLAEASPGWFKGQGSQAPGRFPFRVPLQPGGRGGPFVPSPRPV